jgi:TRAP-type C4-dicarboxylate transport system permease small subunit
VRRLYASVLKLEAILAGLFLLLMVGLIFLGGVARLLHYPLNWTIDLATCFFAWACFLCADIAWRKGALISLDFLAARAAPALRRGLEYCNYLIIAVFLGYLIYSGAVLSHVSWGRSFQGIPGVSYSWVTMSAPVGGTLLLVTTLLRLRDILRRDGFLPKADAP